MRLLVTTTTKDPSAATACQDLLGLLKHMKTTMNDMAETYGLTSIQLYALHAINGNMMIGSVTDDANVITAETITMGRLAQTLHCDASNVTGIVDRLVALSLIGRQEHPQDRRVKLLQLTAKGNRVIASIQAELPGKLGCNRLTDTDKRMLQEIITKLQAT